ncbi:MAG: Peptidase M23 family protein [Candidatus Moranbacteria bacterium GW2011_GWF1_36_4]|nr:MAG: Peptidase M23 family protein [Candidatus Moranbacteria bacterium GW2011_GWF1_36_4]
MAKWIFDVLFTGVVSFVAYVILIAIERKQIANLVIMVAVMMALLVTMQDLTPVIEKWSARIDSLQNTAENISNITGNKSWTMPMKGEITQNFKSKDHHGLDIAGVVGMPVEATRKGQVTRVEWNDIYGNMIVIDHGNGLESLYGHLSGSSVKVGWPVIAGTKIGLCGNTGNSFGSHLHFEIRKNGTCIDPMYYLK